MTAHLKQKILKAHGNHAEAPAEPSCLSLSPFLVWNMCVSHKTMRLDIPFPSLPLLALIILVLALLHFHMSTQVSWVHVNAITCIYWLLCSSRLCPSLWAQNKCQLLFHDLLPREGAIGSSTHKAKTLPGQPMWAQGCGRVRLPRRVLRLGWLLWP